MTTKDFKEYVKTGQALDTEEIHRFMDEMSDEARRITFRLNTAYRTPDEVRELLSELFGYEVPQSLRVFPPLYADFGKNIAVGEHVFINACCHFQDQGGITIGDGVFIAPKVNLITINHDPNPDNRSATYGKPIVIEDKVWIGIGSTVLPGVRIGYGSIVGANSVVTRDVPPMTVVGGNPAKFIKKIEAK